VQLPGSDILIIMGVGGLFVILAVVGLVWSRVEEKRYYNGLMTRWDLREYLSHWPPRIEAGALKTGGWICLAIGIVLMAIGVFFWITR